MNFETWLKSDLKKPLRVVELDTSFFSKDISANLIGVEVTDDGEPAALEGSVHGYVISSSGTTIPVDGTLNGNKASIILTRACYLDPGGISIAIKVGTTTVCACHGYIHRTETDTVVDPEHVIPSINEIIEKIRQCETAASNANSAAGAANTAAGAANTAAQGANQAKTNANNAAQAINALTVSAQDGTTAGITVTEVDGHKHFAFTIPVSTPSIQVAVQTLPAGSDATISINKEDPYSLENPLITFGIPRGDTGSISNASGVTLPISGSDATSIKDYIDSAKADSDTKIAKRIFSHAVSFTMPTSGGISNSNITADHVLLAYQFYDANGNATPDTLADITWSTGANLLNVSITKVYEAGSVMLVFGAAPSLTSGGGT